MQEQTFPGALESLEPIRKYVSDAASAAGLDRPATYGLCLAVDEIVTNVILHGYQEAGLTGDIRVAAKVEGDQLVVLVEDTGQPYDPNLHASPSEQDLSLPLEERTAGGLGIFLAKNAVHDIQYTAGDRGNVHRFVVLLPRMQELRSPHANR